VEGIFKKSTITNMKLAEVVKQKKLRTHHVAFAIRDLANALPAKAAADKKNKSGGNGSKYGQTG